MKTVCLIIALLIFKVSCSQDPNLARHLTELSKFFSVGKLSEAMHFSDSIRKVIHTRHQHTDTIYPYFLFYSAMALGLLQDYDKCEKVVEELEKLVINRYGKDHIKYFAAVNIHYLAYHRRRNYTKTINYLEQCKRTLLSNLARTRQGQTVHSFEATYNEEDIRYLLQSCLADLGFSYIHTNDYEKGRSVMKESLSYYDDAYAVKYDPQSHITHMINFGSFYTYIEDLRSADSIYSELEQWAKKYYGETHPTYGKVLSSLATFYLVIGDTKKSESMLLKAKQNLEGAFQKKTSHYLETLLNLGRIYIHTEQLPKLETVIASVKKSLADIKPESIVPYTETRILLIRYYILKNEKENANQVIQELDKIFYGKDFRSTYVYQSYLSYKAFSLADNRQYDQADSVLSLLIVNAEKTNKTITSEYAGYLLKRSRNLFQSGKQDEGKEVLKKSLTYVSENLRKNFLLLSENQKQSYLGLTEGHFNELNKQAVITADKSLVETAYNAQLLLKGLLLKTSVLANRTADTSLAYKQLFDKYMKLREALVYKYSRPDEESKGLNELISQTELLEKQLVKLSPGFISRQFNPQTSKNILYQLKDNEAAIEFFNFRSNDSVFYGALLIKNTFSAPTAIPLFEKRLLDSILETKMGIKKEASINSRYGNNTLLYTLIWSPLEKQLDGINKVYFSPSGILNKISFAALTINDSTKLCDRYSLVQLNTTATAVNFTGEFIKSPDRLYLYGGVHYDGDTVALRQATLQYNLKDVVSRELPDDIERGNVWQYLPDTKTEVENIQALASNNNIHTSVFMGWHATEESVKSLAGSNSPEILHIATHGFFFSDPKKKSDKSLLAEGRIFRQSDNQLMRSGLILAGANYAWDNKPLSGLEDGILTAYEVSNLFFPNTKLAVLSACETGLGEIQSSEGVYGLQRAFKMAGVKNLIMSLWDVPDIETAEFMTLFYKNLFSGYAIDKAFRETQLTMKNKYKMEAYKWAAWILIK